MKFEVTAAPPSQGAILRGRRQDAVLEIGFFLGMLILFLSIICALAFQDPRIAGLAVVGVFLIGSFTCSQTNNCGELPEDQCGKMLELCEKTPEGRQYRANVLALGRKFVDAELVMMTAWVKQTPHRHNCKKLYGIAVEDSPVDVATNQA